MLEITFAVYSAVLFLAFVFDDGRDNKDDNKQQEEEEEEINRLNQNLERWLLQLDNTKFGRPVIYNDITFSRAPHNKQNATILKNVIEELSLIHI